MTIDSRTIADSYVDISMPTNEAVHMDVDYLDSFVDGQGVVFEHYRALPCPIGRKDPNDSRYVHNHDGCSHGFIYEKAGEIVCSFGSNSKDIRSLDMGLVTGSTAQLTLALFYRDNPQRPVSVAWGDRFYLKSKVGTVIATEMFEHSITGKERLKYPVVRVETLIDSRGNRYHEGQDFRVENGQLVWNGTNQPGMDPKTRRGETCSVRYQHVPFWYVDRILHEIRLLRQGDDVVRAPMSVLVQREHFFENEQNTKGESSRQVLAPRDGAFGPR